MTNQKGFTILEATIAIFILLIGLLAVVQLFPFSLKIIGDSSDLTIGSNLAVSKLEEIRGLTYESIGTGTIETKQRLSSDQTSYLYNFQRQTVVTTIDSNLNTSVSDVGLKQVTVTVFWTSPVSTAEKSTSMSTIVSSY
ncbi:MAG: prepilin-type N-terminal cleavage/methylation domain-containing protein [Patescibacteria group bacterium]|nr:prepilin-type N-terminal cleavage/methylation domain-containing protein [Patescibacteria group bacterium]